MSLLHRPASTTLRGGDFEEDTEVLEPRDAVVTRTCTIPDRPAAAGTRPPPLAGRAPVPWIPPRYEPVTELGRGGMAVVYAARDVTLDRIVALKVPARPRDAYQHVALRREARMLGRAAHQNVIAVFDAGMVAFGAYIAMELVDGDNLAVWLASRRPTPRQVLCIFMAAGRGLAATTSRYGPALRRTCRPSRWPGRQ